MNSIISIRNENLKERLQKEDPITILDNLLTHCVLYNGTVDMTMMRGEGYSFMSIGKYIERSCAGGRYSCYASSTKKIQTTNRESILNR